MSRLKCCYEQIGLSTWIGVAAHGAHDRAVDTDPSLHEDRWSALGPIGSRRVVDDLASNALRAPRRGVVELRLARSDDGLVLMVADSRTGIRWRSSLVPSSASRDPRRAA